MKKLLYIFFLLTVLSDTMKGAHLDRTIVTPGTSISTCTCDATLLKTSSLSDQFGAFFTGILSTDQWPARWSCGNWSDVHGWVYIASDIAIWLTYFMIPIVLGYFLVKKEHRTPLKSTIVLFIAFILACGFTHLIDAAMFWWPAYKLSTIAKLITALISMTAVIALIKIAPKILELKSPRELQKEINHRIEVEKKLARKVKELEQVNELMVGRELKMIELKRKIKTLETK